MTSAHYTSCVSDMRGLVVGAMLGCLVGACSDRRSFADGEATGGAAGEANGDDGGASGASGASGSPPIAGASSMGGMAGGAGGASTPDDKGDCAATQWNDGTTCQELTACGDEEYEKSAPTATSDRSCGPLMVCGAGTFVSTPPTATSDRPCSPCAASTFSSVLNAEACAPWSECETGKTESVPPTLASDRVCSTCGAGKYEAAGTCQMLTVCSSKQYETKPATATSDRDCDDLTACKSGFMQTAAPTATTDRQCGACSQGSFSNTENALTCKPWSTCGANQKVSVAGTSTTDVVCVDKPVCSTASDRTCSVDCPCESGEGVCTANNQCVSGATCVSGSGKKVGRAGNTCLAAHCNNDKQDSGETSVDCGGECGCRATFETITLSGIPAGATFSQLKAMSRDGKRFAAYISRNRSAFPAAIAADGKVTELETYGKGGNLETASADGNVLVGTMGCANPPSCTDLTWSMAQWTGAAAPKVISGLGTARRVSSSGAIIAGEYYDSGTGVTQVFIINGNQRQTVPEMDSVGGLTPDGKYIAGRLRVGVQGGLWYAQTQSITKVGSTSWNATNIRGANGTDPVVIGDGHTTDDTNVGFRWKGGALTDLGFLAGGKYTLPHAVSADGGTIVGTTGSNAYQIAFIWTEKTKLVSVLDELASRGLELPVDLTLKYANFISDDGKIIVGSELTTPPTFWRVVLD